MVQLIGLPKTCVSNLPSKVRVSEVDLWEVIRCEGSATICISAPKSLFEHSSM